MTFKSIYEIEAWQLARELNKEVFSALSKCKDLRNIDLAKHLSKTTGSIMDNIAEGYGRGGNKEFIHFLSIALGSTVEARSQLTRAFDCDLISKEEFDQFFDLNLMIGKKIGGLIRYLKNSKFKGTKFKRT